MNNASRPDSTFSVIIPTIWKCPDNLVELAKRLIVNDYYGQLLIIDNLGHEDSHDVVREELRRCGAIIVRLPYNVLVNAAWNIGLCLASQERFLLLNDDVQIYSTCLSDLARVLNESPNAGLVGYAMDCVSEQAIPSEQYRSVEACVVEDLKTNYGCCMAGWTTAYTMIPRSLKLFAGDNWLFYASRAAGLVNYSITNKRIQHLLSVSSRAFPEFARADWEEFQRLWSERQ